MTTDPDDAAFDYDEDESGCDHVDYEVNWDGRASCHCGHSWWLTASEHDHYLECATAWAEQYDAALRREHSWWMRLWRRIETLMARWPIRRRTFGGVNLDDEIPF